MLAASLKEGGAFAEGAGLKKLMHLHCQLLGRVAAVQDDKLMKGCFGRAQPLFRKGWVTKLVEELPEVKDVTELVGFLHLISAHCLKKGNTEAFAAVKPRLIECYNKALAATQGREGVKVSRDLTVAFRGLMEWLSHDDLAALFPEMVRILRRTPDMYFDSISLSIRHLRVDPSRYIEQIAPTICENLSKEKLRDQTLELVSALLAQSSETSAVLELGSAVHKALAGKGPGGTLKNWQERQGPLQCLHAILTQCKGKGIVPLVEESFATIVAATEKESNDATKAIGFRLLGTCIRRGQVVSPAFFKEANKQMESSVPEVRRAVMEGLREGFQAGDVLDKCTDLVPGLIKVVQTAAKKVLFRGNAAMALRMLMMLSKADDKANAKLEEAKLWPTLLGKESCLLLLVEAGEGSTEELLALVEVIEALLLDYSAVLRKVSGGKVVVAQMLCRLLTHSTFKVYKAAVAATNRVQEEDVELLPLVLAELSAHLAAEGDRQGKEEEALTGPHSSVRFGRALLGVVPAASADQWQMLWQLLLLTHSDAMLGGVRAGKDADSGSPVWRQLEGRFGDSGRKTVQDSIEELAEAMLGEEGAKSTEAPRRAAALRAVEAVVRMDVPGAVGVLVERASGECDAEELLALSEWDLEVFATKAGELAGQNKGEYVPEERVDANVRISKEDKKLYGALAKELGGAKKKTGEKPKMTKQEEEVFKAKLAEQAAIRSRVAALKFSAEIGLGVVCAVCRGNRAAAHGVLGELSAVVAAVAPSPLMRAALPDALAALVSSCRCRVPAVVAEVLQSVLEKREDEEAASPARVASAIKAVWTAANMQPLPGPSFAVLFPVLRHALLEARVPSEAQDKAMETVGMHTALDEAWPRADMLAVMIELMGRVPRLRKHAVAVILKLSAALAPAQISEHLDGCLSAVAAVRLACLQGLEKVPDLPGEEPHVYLQATLFLMQHDAEEEVKALASALYTRFAFSAEDAETSQLTELLMHETESVRKSAGEAMASLVKLHPSAAQEMVGQLKQLYTENKGDEGNPIARSGVAMCLQSIAEHISKRELIVLFPFLVSDKEQGLSDPDDKVRQEMTKAGLKLVEVHGEGSMELLHPMLQNQLNKPDTGTWQGDLLREGSVLLLATLAKFLPKGDEKVREVMDRLVHALRTPSEPVQRSAATAMSPLMGMLGGGPDDVRPLMQQMMAALLEGETYGDRRGAAFGLAGMVKGLGISALKAYEVMTTLQAAAADKKNETRRQGALFGFEALSEKLGRLFEPYVIHILPILLNSCGDNDVGVREAADAAAKAVMSQLSGQGVKLVMPALLQGVEDRAWRTKSAAVELLGAMAYCAPRQLSTCLPTIVPVMAQAVSDTHVKVREGAKEALAQVGNVIKNPEILAIAPILIDSLSDPEKTAKALEVVIETTFVNAVDAPSLALMVPVVQRGLKHRSTDLKKKAATIVGNMCNLVSDPKDVSPYMGDLLPILKQSILDPSPEMRTTAAQALGSLVRSMDDKDYEDLEEYLLATCKSEGGSAERGGAALGLAEVLGSAPIERFEGVLDEVLLQCSNRQAHVREGYFSLLSCLPNSMEEKLESYIPRILPTILGGLSDEMESVREVALKAGHGMVDKFAETAMPLVLPAIEKGLYDEAWRIRSSSVHLLGDVLSKITGRNWKIYSGNATVDDLEEGMGDKTSEAKIGEVLGEERRNKLLAAVYMLRSDMNPSVCVASFQVWKSVVRSQLQTLKTILSTLMDTLIECLSSPSEEKKAVAGKAMGEMVSKLGERVLSDVIPILQRGLKMDNMLERAGVCLGLSEVVANCSRQQISLYLDDVVSTIRIALCDPEAEVRGASAIAFDALFKAIGQRAIEEIVPALLEKLEDDSSNALEGLRQLLNVRGKIVLPFLIPVLTAPPITAANAKALGALASVAGKELAPRIPTILGALSDGMDDGDDPEAIALAAEKVVLAVPQDGVRMMVLELLRRLEDVTTPQTRASSARLLAAFCKGTALDFEDFKPDMVKGLVHLFGADEEPVLAAAHTALAALVGHMEASEKKDDAKAPSVSCGVHVGVVLDEVKQLATQAAAGGVTGFNRSKGLAPILPFFLQALMHGATPETREQAAEGLGELVQATSEAALKPMVVQMSGPLIRIIGDRFPWQVKAAIVRTLLLLLQKGGIMMKPFLPQLQTTFVKSLKEHSKVVRARSVQGLAQLVTMITRVDPLVNDLIAGIKTSDSGMRLSHMSALEATLGRAGKSISAPVVANAISLLQDLMTQEEDDVRGQAAAAYGAHAANVPDEEVQAQLQTLLEDEGVWTKRHGQTLALNSVIKHLHRNGRDAPAGAAIEAIMEKLKALAKDDRVPVREALAAVCGNALRVMLTLGNQEGTAKALWKLLSALVADRAAEVKGEGLKAVKGVSRGVGLDKMEGQVAEVVMAVFQALKEKSVPVRTAAERCMVHLLQLYSGMGICEAVCESLKDADKKSITDYCQRQVDKGCDANALSDDDEDDGEE